MKHIFVDTNFFMQFKAYDAVKWTEIFNDDVFIIITRTVLKEIDNHKNSSNKRRSGRARSMISLIRELTDATKAVTRNGSLIQIGIIERFDFSVKRKEFLDLDKSDDSIVNEVLTWAENNPGEEYCIATGDVHLNITCRDCGVQYYELPEDWRLPAEPDDRDKKIMALEKELESSRKKCPTLTVTADRDFCDVDLKIFSKLSCEEITNLSERIFEEFPEKTNFENDMQTTKEDRRLESFSQISNIGWMGATKCTWHLPTKKHIESYHNKYIAWKHDVTTRIESLSESILNEISIFSVEFTLENTGTAPAEDVHVEISVSSNMLILPEGTEPKKLPFGRQHIDLPEVPIPPKKQFINTSPLVTALPYFNEHSVPSLFSKNFINREVDKFYWEPEKPKIPVKKWEFSCPEFRHKIAKEHFPLYVLIPESGVNGELYIEISVYSRQLPSPLVKKLPVRPRKFQVDIFQRISRSIDSYINKEKNLIKKGK